MELGAKLRESRNLWRYASESTDELEEQIGAFFDAQPYEIHVENISGQDLYRMRLGARIPRRCNRLTSKVARSLHAALDLLVSEFADQKRLSKRAQTQFPFSPSGTEFEEFLHKHRAQLPKEALDAIRRSRPYPQGNKTFHALLQISQTAPRKLLKAGAHANVVLVHQQQKDAMAGPATLSAPIWNEYRREVTMLATDPNSQLSGQTQVRFFVGFRDIPAINDIPIITVLKYQLQVADTLISAFENSYQRSRPPLRGEPKSVDDIDSVSG